MQFYFYFLWHLISLFFWHNRTIWQMRQLHLMKLFHLTVGDSGPIVEGHRLEDIGDKCSHFLKVQLILVPGQHVEVDFMATVLKGNAGGTHYSWALCEQIANRSRTFSRSEQSTRQSVLAFSSSISRNSESPSPSKSLLWQPGVLENLDVRHRTRLWIREG